MPPPLLLGERPYAAPHASDVPGIVARLAEDEGVAALLRGGNAQAVEDPDLQGSRIVEAVFVLLLPEKVDDAYPRLSSIRAFASRKSYARLSSPGSRG